MASRSRAPAPLDDTHRDTHGDVSEPGPLRWTRERVAIAAALWLVGLIALVVMSVFAHQYKTFPFDVPIEQWVQNLLRYPALTRFITFASDANWPVPEGAIVIVVTLALGVLRRFREAIAALFAGFGAANISFLLNGIVARPRPSGGGIHAVENIGLHSYPSGHASHVVAFYGLLLYLALREGQAHPAWRRWLWVIEVICGYFLLFIGPSRVLEGEHWPSDVVASYLLGALWLGLAIALYHALGLWWERHQQRRQHRDAGMASPP